MKNIGKLHELIPYKVKLRSYAESSLLGGSVMLIGGRKQLPNLGLYYFGFIQPNSYIFLARDFCLAQPNAHPLRSLFLP